MNIDWTLALGIVYLASAIISRGLPQMDKEKRERMHIFHWMFYTALVVSSFVGWLTILLFKWVFNHGFVQVFHTSPIHFKEALFLFILLFMFSPSYNNRVIVE